jgi:hypothetical protein
MHRDHHIIIIMATLKQTKECKMGVLRFPWESSLLSFELLDKRTGTRMVASHNKKSITSFTSSKHFGFFFFSKTLSPISFV